MQTFHVASKSLRLFTSCYNNNIFDICHLICDFCS